MPLNPDCMQIVMSFTKSPPVNKKDNEVRDKSLQTKSASAIQKAFRKRNTHISRVFSLVYPRIQALKSVNLNTILYLCVTSFWREMQHWNLYASTVIVLYCVLLPLISATYLLVFPFRKQLNRISLYHLVMLRRGVQILPVLGMFVWKMILLWYPTDNKSFLDTLCINFMRDISYTNVLLSICVIAYPYVSHNKHTIAGNLFGECNPGLFRCEKVLNKCIGRL